MGIVLAASSLLAVVSLLLLVPRDRYGPTAETA
jgi:hypothetical protein